MTSYDARPGPAVRVVAARDEDFGGWLRLAAEVEPLFGPMASDPRFHEKLRASIAAGAAFCVRDGDGPPGCSLLGGVMVSRRAAGGSIGWLAVTKPHRRHGVGRALLERGLDALAGAAEVRVTTFTEQDPDGAPARDLYRAAGFRAAEPGPVNPAGRPTQVFRKELR